ncbi:unnamed protein product [Chrysoparadoxa australica]
MDYYRNFLPLQLPSLDDGGGTSLVCYRCSGAQLPVVLTAPHGGNAEFGHQSTRFLPRPDDMPGVRTLADVGTAQLLEEIDGKLQQLTGKSPYMVVARFHRMYIDANRDVDVPAEYATCPGCTEARETHLRYHYSIDRCVRSIKACCREQRVLLIDIHGQASHPSSVLIGTRDGSTADVPYLHREGEGFLWHLRQLYGGVIKPGVGEEEVSGYKGGHTVHRHAGRGIDAVQLEFGSSLRASQARAEVGEKVAKAIYHHLQPLAPFIASLGVRCTSTLNSLSVFPNQSKIPRPPNEISSAITPMGRGEQGPRCWSAAEAGHHNSQRFIRVPPSQAPAAQGQASSLL